MPVWLTWLFGFVAVTAESAFLAATGFDAFCLQSGLIFAIALGLRRDFIPGAWTLAALIPIVEWYAGGPKGFYGLGLCVVFLAVQSVRAWLPQGWGLLQLATGAGAVVLHALVVAGATTLLQVTVPVASAALWSIPTGILGVVVGLWPARWVLERGDAFFEGTRRRRLFD